MGNTCKPMAVSFQCMTKSTTKKKKKKEWIHVNVSLICFATEQKQAQHRKAAIFQ